jgi:hypothetical protein
MFLLTTVKNTYNLLSFDHDNAPGYDLFFEGTDLSGIDFDLRYELKKKSSMKQLAKTHLIQSTGPELISNQLRSIIEETAPGTVDFFEPRITCGAEEVKGFSAINVRSKLQCMDLTKSEYRQTNFDSSNPSYLFSYMKLLDDQQYNAEIFRCAEQHRYLVISENIKIACKNNSISGLMFCRAIDLTYEDRTECEKS